MLSLVFVPDLDIKPTETGWGRGGRGGSSHDYNDALVGGGVRRHSRVRVANAMVGYGVSAHVVRVCSSSSVSHCTSTTVLQVPVPRFRPTSPVIDPTGSIAVNIHSHVSWNSYSVGPARDFTMVDSGQPWSKITQLRAWHC